MCRSNGGGIGDEVQEVIVVERCRKVIVVLHVIIVLHRSKTSLLFVR